MLVKSLTHNYKSKCYSKFVGNCDADISNRHGPAQ